MSYIIIILCTIVHIELLLIDFFLQYFVLYYVETYTYKAKYIKRRI